MKQDRPEPITPAYKRIKYTSNQLIEIGKKCTGLPCPPEIPLMLRTNEAPDPTSELGNEKVKYAPGSG